MNRNKISIIITLCAAMVFALSGCGGGGGNAPNNKSTAAVAGPAQSVVSGDVVALNGEQSTGADGNLITYAWSLVATPYLSSVVLDRPTDVNPTFTPDMPGQYTLKLKITDSTSKTAEDTITVTVTDSTENAFPVANAGAPQIVLTGAVVTLDGRKSSDSNGDFLTYSWTFYQVPSGSTATLTNATGVYPTFTPDMSGDYYVNLIVSDGKVRSTVSTVKITASTEDNNAAPVANAGITQTVAVGKIVSLDGSKSSDANITDTLTYSWSFTSTPDGTMPTLSSATIAMPTFTATTVGAYVLNLLVSDGKENSTAAVVTINVVANVTPVAFAGFNRSVITGVTVQLDGTSSSDANGDTLTYHWSLAGPAGSHAALSSATATKPIFVPDVAGVYSVDLVVNDGKVDSEAVTVVITSAATSTVIPFANAGTATRTVITGAVVALDGSRSDDVDGDPLTSYTWAMASRPVGSVAIISNVAAIKPTFTADKAGVYSVTLVVSDGTVNSLPATVTITASDPYIELSRVAYYGDDILALPYSQAVVSTPIVTSGSATLATFKLAAIGANYTVSNLTVTSSSSAVTPSFRNLSNGTISTGSQKVFYLVATPTSGSTVTVTYSFTVTKDVAGSTGKTFTYTASLKTL